MSAVPQGIGPALLADATPEGSTSPNTPVDVAFILKAQHLTGLENKVSAGWSGKYLTVSEFAARYGQPTWVINDLSKYLAKFGITTTAYPDNLDVTAYGTAEEFNQALSIALKDYQVTEPVPGAMAMHGAPATQQATVHGTTGPVYLPSYLASRILSILGLTNYGPFVSQALPALHALGTAPATTTTTTCDPAKKPCIPPGERTPISFEDTYGLRPLENQADLGQGQTLAIVTLASLNPGAPETFWKDYLHLSVVPNKVQIVNVDGGAGAPSLNAGSSETDLDVEQSGAIAPDARVVVYEAPNTDNGFVDAFFAAASQNIAGSISTSWGESETAIQAAVLAGQESATYAQAFNEAFLESAAQGQSVFVASGDDGAYDPDGDIGTTNLGVDNPGDSPYVTAAGGTTLAGVQTYAAKRKNGSTLVEAVDIPHQMTWSWDYLWPMYKVFGGTSKASFAESAVGGSGGGYSVLFARPSYQVGVGASSYSDYEYLTPTAYKDTYGLPLPTKWVFNDHPMLATGTMTMGRAVPDVVFDADPQTGYALYDPQFLPVYGTPVEEYGGTSFVAPELNGTTAVFESALGHRVGFWNPTIYKLAAGPNSPFHPLDGHAVYGSKYYASETIGKNGKTYPGAKIYGTFSNNNLYYTGTSGHIYNPGSGLGYANLSKLEADLAAEG
jgi:kumamolisin